MTVRRLHDTGHTMVLPLIILIFTSIRKISSIVDRTYGISIDGFQRNDCAWIRIMVAAMSLVLLIILVITFAFTIKDSDEGQISMAQILK